MRGRQEDVAAASRPPPLTVGNAAKLYCLRFIERLIRERDEPIRILDLGCGRALNFVELLRRHPGTRYVGIEPLADEAARARVNLRGFDAEIVEQSGYGADKRLDERFDVVTSFSVLEHVYRRAAYVHAAAGCLADDGYLLVNYDAGHFRVPSTRDRAKNLVGPVLARLGREGYYQRLVRDREFLDLAHRAGLRIVESHVFNSRLKAVYPFVPEPARGEFMERWLELELWLNEVLPPYEDSDSERFFTRNFILERAEGAPPE